MPLALKILLRNWRGGQLGLILAALVLAVAMVTSIALLAERVEKALVVQSSNFLAADAVVHSSELIDDEWLRKARELGIETAKTATFSSMVFSSKGSGENIVERNHLASVKVVQGNYPLRGTVKLSEVPFSADPAMHQVVIKGPKKGQAWVDARVLPLLDIQLGDTLEVGEVALRVVKVIIEEPDRGGTFSLFGARVLMSWDDLQASGVVQPGSRVDYRLLLAGAQKPLGSFLHWLKPQLDVHDRVIMPDQAQASIEDTMKKGRRFLLLAGSVGVMLAAIALALASHQFARQQTAQVALMKSWGVAASRVRRLYLQQSLWLGLSGSLVGLLLGWAIHLALIALVRSWLPAELPHAQWQPYITGFATGMICLAGFMLPAIWHLPAQSPLAVLRQDIRQAPISLLFRVFFAAAAIGGLLLWYSQNIFLALGFMLGFALIIGLSMSVGLLGLRVARMYGERLGGSWRLGLASLWRKKSASLIQMAGFSAAIALLMIMTVIRTSLVNEWRWQLADDAPNHFLVNVAPHETAGVATILERSALKDSGWYSMVRGRITHINGEPPSEALRNREEELQRELNLSWSNDLPQGNNIVAGHWWDTLDALPNDLLGEFIPVSIEQDMAGEIGVTLGDRLRFDVGGLQFEAVIVSLRALNWDSMTPNFYLLFPAGYLEDYPRMNMTSVYVPPQKKQVVNEILQNYPTVLMLELDNIIDRIRTIVSQVTRGLELMTLMILGCGVLVMFAAVGLSMDQRLHESALLRALGSSRKLILGVQWVEFSTLGLLAGLLAALGAEIAVAILQQQMFNLAFGFHPWLWVVGPLSGGLLVGMLGVVYSRRAVVQPPLQVLE
jgi:putative ABC transport system permease protein